MKLRGCFKKEQQSFQSARNRLRENRPGGASTRLRVTTITEPRKKIFHMWDTLYLSWTKKTVPGSVTVHCEDRTKALWAPTPARSLVEILAFQTLAFIRAYVWCFMLSGCKEAVSALKKKKPTTTPKNPQPCPKNPNPTVCLIFSPRNG